MGGLPHGAVRGRRLIRSSAHTGAIRDDRGRNRTRASPNSPAAAHATSPEHGGQHAGRGGPTSQSPLQIGGEPAVCVPSISHTTLRPGPSPPAPGSLYVHPRRHAVREFSSRDGQGLHPVHDLAPPPPDRPGRDSHRPRERPLFHLPVDRRTAQARDLLDVPSAHQSVIHMSQPLSSPSRPPWARLDDRILYLSVGPVCSWCAGIGFRGLHCGASTISPMLKFLTKQVAAVLAPRSNPQRRHPSPPVSATPYTRPLPIRLTHPVVGTAPKERGLILHSLHDQFIDCKGLSEDRFAAVRPSTMRRV